jgi:hypothetical protein
MQRFRAFVIGLLLVLALNASGATRLFVTDSGATERLVRRLMVVDSGGTTRAVKRLFVIDSGGTARLVFTSSLHETTITVGDDGVPINYGYNNGLFGSIGSGTYLDGGGNSRTISIAMWDGSNVQFWLNAAGIANTDTTFASISLDGTTLNRSDATYNGAAGGGIRSSWVWSAGFFVTSGSVALVIR